MIWLCETCGDPFCDSCDPVPVEIEPPLCPECLRESAEPDPDMERKAAMEAGL